MCIRDFPQFFYFSGSSVEMRNDNQSDLRIKRESPLQGCGIHIPGIIFRIDEDGFSTLISHRIHRGIKGHVAAEDLFSFQNTMSNLRLTVKLLPRQFYGKVQGRSSVREPHRIWTPDFFSRQAFHLVNVLADRADPVRADGLIDPFLLFSMHRRRGEPNFFLKRHNCHCSGSSLTLFAAFTGHAAPVSVSPGTETIVKSSVMTDFGSNSSPVSSRIQTLPSSTPSSSGIGISSHIVPGCVQ